MWRKLSKNDQRWKIGQAAETAVVTAGQSNKRRQRGSRHGAAVQDAETANDFQLNRLGGENVGSPPRRCSSRRNLPVPGTPQAGVSFNLEVEQLSNQISSSQMIRDDDDGDSVSGLDEIQILPPQHRDLDDVETSMADDAVEALSAGCVDSSVFDAFAEDVDVVPSHSLRSASAASVSTSVLDVLSIGVSFHTIEESGKHKCIRYSFNRSICSYN